MTDVRGVVAETGDEEVEAETRHIHVDDQRREIARQIEPLQTEIDQDPRGIDQSQGQETPPEGNYPPPPFNPSYDPHILKIKVINDV